MDLVKRVRGLFGSGKAAKQAAAAERRDERQRSDDAFRKAVKG